MHINNVLFLTSISNHIHYSTANTLDNMKVATREDSLKNVMRNYAMRGFSMGVIFLDIQFKYVKDRNLLRVTINIVSREEHLK